MGLLTPGCQAARPYELGAAPGLFPIYVRALAYLRAKRGREAAAEFQKIVDHRGIAPTAPEHSLAKLGLGRAYVMTGDRAKARAAYQDFFTLWKDADPRHHNPEGSQGGIRDPKVAISTLPQFHSYKTTQGLRRD